MAALLADNLPVPPPNEALLALGIEGSANKVGVGLIRYVPATGAYDILANPRETYVTPPGHGLPAPRDGAAPPAARRAAGPEMFARGRRRRVRDRLRLLHARARHGRPAAELRVAARVLARLWRVPLVPVNHCVAHIEMGRVATDVSDPVVLYVSGRQHAGVGVFKALLHFRGDDRHRGGELSGPVRAGAGAVERPVARLQHREISSGREKFAPLPYVVKGMDVSFSGLLTFISQNAPKLLAGGHTPSDLCYSAPGDDLRHVGGGDGAGHGALRPEGRAAGRRRRLQQGGRVGDDGRDGAGGAAARAATWTTATASTTAP